MDLQGFVIISASFSPDEQTLYLVCVLKLNFLVFDSQEEVCCNFLSNLLMMSVLTLECRPFSLLASCKDSKNIFLPFYGALNLFLRTMKSVR